MFDHDLLKRDRPLGSVFLPLPSLPRDSTLDRDFQMSGVKSGSVQMSITRASLTSQELRQVADQLAGLDHCVRDKDLRKYGISFEQLIGKLPYISAQPVAPQTGGRRRFIDYLPALRQLQSLLPSPTFELKVRSWGKRFSHSTHIFQSNFFFLQNQRSIAKLMRIFRSHFVTSTEDQPTSALWLSDIDLSHITQQSHPNLANVNLASIFGQNQQQHWTQHSLYLLLLRMFPNRIKSFAANSEAGWAVVWFKRVEDAAAAALTLYDLELANASFGPRIDASHPLESAARAGFLLMSECVYLG